MYFHISSAHLVLCLILAFAILCATAAVAFSTVKSTQVELEHFIRPVTAGATATAGISSSPSSSDVDNGISASSGGASATASATAP